MGAICTSLITSQEESMYDQARVILILPKRRMLEMSDSVFHSTPQEQELGLHSARPLLPEQFFASWNDARTLTSTKQMENGLYGGYSSISQNKFRQGY